MFTRIVALLLFALPGILLAENPFITKFGGPYPALSQTYKQSALQYGKFWLDTYSVLGKDALKDKAEYATFVKGEVEPRLSTLKPSTPEEEKVKAAAVFIRKVFDAQVDPAGLKQEDVAAIDAFIAAALPPGEKVTPGDKFGWVLIRYQEFVLGMTLEQVKKLQGK